MVVICLQWDMIVQIPCYLECLFTTHKYELDNILYDQSVHIWEYLIHVSHKYVCSLLW